MHLVNQDNTSILASSVMTLPNKEIHIWRLRLADAYFYSGLISLLNETETARANKFIQPDDRIRYIVGRALLRILLGKYLGTSPNDVAFSYNPFGKPYIQGCKVAFNTTHSGDVIAWAFSKTDYLGIDIEKVRPLMETLNYDFLFSVRERLYLEGIHPAEQLRAFYRLWVRKESLLKALGIGFSAEPPQFDILESRPVIALDSPIPSPQLYVFDMEWPCQHFAAITSGFSNPNVRYCQLNRGGAGSEQTYNKLIEGCRPFHVTFSMRISKE